MSILSFDGYEADLSQVSFLRRYPNSANIPANFPLQPGRLGGLALRHDSGANPLIEIDLPESASDELCFGTGIRLGGITSSFNFILVENESGNDTFYLTLFPLGTGFGIAAKRFDAAGTTSTLEYLQSEYPLSFDDWHYLEVRAPLRQGSAGVIIRIDGDTLVSNYASRADVGSGFSIVYINMVKAASSYIEIDDTYIARGSEFALLGPGAQISSLYPKLDSTRGWAVTGAGDKAHFDAVDDAGDQEVDDDVSYVSASSPGVRDTYIYREPVGIRNTVSAVQLHSDVRADSGAALQFEPIINDVIMPRLTAPASGTYARRVIQYNTNPITEKAWSIESLDEITAGVKIPGDEVPPGSSLYFTLKGGSQAYILLDEEEDLPILIGTIPVQVLDVGGVYFPLTLKDGSPKEIHFQSAVITASWEPWNQAKFLAGSQKVYNAHFRADGGYLEAPDGVTQTYTIANPWNIRIAFNTTTLQAGEIFLSTLSGTTATGSHYSIPGGNTRSVGVGVDHIDVPVQINASTWHKAKTAKFWMEASNNIEVTGQREWHLWVYPNVQPPSLQFSSANVNASGPGPTGVIVPISQSAVSQEDTSIYYRFKGSGGTWIRNTHYSYTPPSINAGATSINDVVTILPQAFVDFPGQSLVVYLDHEPSDSSQESFWQFTEDWIQEGALTEDDTRKENESDGEFVYPYAGEVGTHAPGGGNNAEAFDRYFGWFIKKQSSFGISTPVLKPTGEEMQMLVSPSYLENNVSDWYIRESFFLEDFSGGRGRKQVYKNYILCGSYVHPFNETEAAPYKNSRFFVFGPRNRAPGDMEMQATFQRRDTEAEADLGSRNVFMPFWHNGTLQTGSLFWNGSWWSPWARDNMDPNSELGIEIETDPDTGQEYLRFWTLIVVDGVNWVKTNTGGFLGGKSGVADDNGSNTVLVDNSATFQSWRVGFGDVIYNKTDGSESYVTFVDTQKQITVAGLHGGLDNTFASGDSYNINRNYRTQVAAVSDLATGLRVTITNFGGVTDIESEEGVGKFDQVENVGGGGGIPGLYSIDFEKDHATVYGESGIGADWIFLKGVTSAQIKPLDVLYIRHQSVQPLPDDIWSGNGIFRYNHVAIGDSYNEQQNSRDIVGTAKEHGILAWAPQYLVASNRSDLLRGNKPDPFYGPEDPSVGDEKSRYWEKQGAWWEPRGNATRLAGGQTSFTINLI